MVSLRKKADTDSDPYGSKPYNSKANSAGPHRLSA